MRRLVLILAAALVAAPVASAKLPLRSCFVGSASGMCGRLVVPENRARPEGRKISLRVMVLPAMAAKPRPDPVFYLAGGPGGAATDSAATMRTVFGELGWDRDIVLVDQRGTGGSHALACPKPKGDFETQEQVAAFMRACWRTLDGDPTQYGTVAAMDDLDAVRAALGYRTVNLYGASYGATAAQVYLNRHPQSVRTVVLDGGTLLDIPIFERIGSNGQRALDLIAERCAHDKQCHRSFPTWRADLPKLIARLDAKPLRTKVAGTPVTLNGAGAAGVIQSMSLNAVDTSQIPYVVANAVRGRFAPLARAALRPSSGNAPPTAVMPYSIMCNEPWALRRPAQAAADAKGTYLAGAVKGWAAQQRIVCASFPKRAEHAQDWRRPDSEVPLLAVLGGADPQDPWSNIAGIRESMPNSRIVVAPGQGHTVGHLGCMPDLIAAFVKRGSAKGLDVSCARSVGFPTWVA